MNLKFTKSISLLVIIAIISLNYSTSFANEKVIRPNIEDIKADSYIVIDKNTGNIILEKNSNLSIHPASLTKILTAIIALENIQPNDIITVSQNAGSLSMYESTIALMPGEKMPFNDILHGLLLGSGNDSAIAIAEHISGTIGAFTTIMNNKSKEIGLKNSSWVNPSGVTDAGHKTTSQDIANLTKYACKNETFKKIVQTKYYSLPITNMHPYSDWNVLTNTNKLMILQNNFFLNDSLYKITGVKTGTTPAAGSNLITAAHGQNGLELICVVNGVRERESTNIWIYTLALLEKASSITEGVQSILKENEPILSDDKILSKRAFSIFNPTEYDYDIKIISENEGSVIVKAGEENFYKGETHIADIIDISTVSEDEIITPDDKNDKSENFILWIGIGIAVILFSILVFSLVNRNNRKSKSRRIRRF